MQVSPYESLRNLFGDVDTLDAGTALGPMQNLSSCHNAVRCGLSTDCPRTLVAELGSGLSRVVHRRTATGGRHSCRPRELVGLNPSAGGSDGPLLPSCAGSDALPLVIRRRSWTSLMSVRRNAERLRISTIIAWISRRDRSLSSRKTDGTNWFLVSALCNAARSHSQNIFTICIRIASEWRQWSGDTPPHPLTGTRGLHYTPLPRPSPIYLKSQQGLGL